MSVAYPNQNNVGPSSDSFSASAAFSFDQHNPTQVFGAINSDPQSQMQDQMPGQMPSQSLSVPMIQVSQAGFTSDYDMGNAPRDEDIDIDLDLDTYDEDDDMNLDDLSATPIPTVIDDPMETAANIPASSLIFGQPGLSVPSGRYNMEQANDDEMVDDALSQVINEVMTDADPPEVIVQYDFQALQPIQPLQQFQQQQPIQHLPVEQQTTAQQQSVQQQHIQQESTQQVPEQTSEQPQNQASQPSNQPTTAESGISNPEVLAGSPDKTTSAQELPAATEEPNVDVSSTPFGSEVVKPQSPPSNAQNVERQNPEEQLLEPEIVPPTEDPATPPSLPTPHADELKTPQASNHKTPKHQTPSSSTDPLRISQAETIALENPTPDVNQRDWYALEGQGVSGSPPAPTYPAHQEIPTSPLHGPSGSGSSRRSLPSDPEALSPHTPHSEQDTERVPPSQSSQHLEEESSHDQGHEQTRDEGHTDVAHDDPLLTHPVLVIYRDLEFSLFPISGEKSNLPETCFLPDRSHLGSPLSKLVAALRDVLGEEFTSSEELILNFTALGVEFEEENNQMNNFTLYDLLGLFSKLLAQDGVEEARPLHISLTSRKKYIPRLEMIHSHIVEGGGLASWGHILASTHGQPPESAQANEPGDAPLEKAKTATDEHADDELELEEFEKGLGAEDVYYGGETHQTDVQPEVTTVATVDVPQSPSQTIIQERKMSATQETSNTDVSNVPETQLSQHLEATPNAEVRLNVVDHSRDSSYIKDDEASFVTAEEKQQDTSVLYSASRSYGLPDSPSSNEEPELKSEEHHKGIADYTHNYEELGVEENQVGNHDAYDIHLLPFLDDGLLNFDEQDHDHREEKEEDEEEDAQDEKSSSTLHEVPEGETDNQAILQGSSKDGTDNINDTNWQEWSYAEADENEHGEYQYEEGHEGSAYVEAAYDLPEDLSETAEAAGDTFELDPNEFAEYPLPFSEVDDEEEPEYDDDAPLLGLDHHETLSTATSTKRAREDDDEEIEDELSENGEVRGSPPASKKHKSL
ncbi:hypothetical protein AOL_s00097g491 [Orbilia oligospora ATCC 24927]|uniref:Uncharacterized protein n=1 Tax=Arthrobotrys oligospora (strain ATCC 24927 / CBS 115.81 / DSM 1491) TaxID=756982 RepID=G1XJG4_ARTOA|nr:hypothetical protein AOL_s00097g491 [Orbilia oligospora ATCC 24927]EGX46743.1 hypothetical protein AOL_s00097g491 [Orbilia oligospora ATCC 24927]